MARKNGGLREWQQVGQLTVNDPNSLDEKGKKLFFAANNGEVIDIRYRGGSSPGASRKITPVKLFRKSQYGSVYVEAYCHKRGEVRIFKLDRMDLLGSTFITRKSDSVLCSTPVPNHTVYKPKSNNSKSVMSG
jgi:predicted DNA-binding transcriptional regulator YafY